MGQLVNSLPIFSVLKGLFASFPINHLQQIGLLYIKSGGHLLY